MGNLKQYIVIAKANDDFFIKMVAAETKNRAHIETFDRLVAEIGRPFKFYSFAIQVPFIRRKSV